MLLVRQASKPVFGTSQYLSKRKSNNRCTGKLVTDLCCYLMCMLLCNLLQGTDCDLVSSVWLPERRENLEAALWAFGRIQKKEAEKKKKIYNNITLHKRWDFADALSWSLTNCIENTAYVKFSQGSPLQMDPKRSPPSNHPSVPRTMTYYDQRFSDLNCSTNCKAYIDMTMMQHTNHHSASFIIYLTCMLFPRVDWIAFRQ